MLCGELGNRLSLYYEQLKKIHGRRINAVRKRMKKIFFKLYVAGAGYCYLYQTRHRDYSGYRVYKFGKKGSETSAGKLCSYFKLSGNGILYGGGRPGEMESKGRL